MTWIAAAHKGLHLTNANFNALVEDLQTAMDKCNIPLSPPRIVSWRVWRRTNARLSRNEKISGGSVFPAGSRSAAFAADPAHTIVQSGRTFHPAEVTINRGESLTFTNNDEFIHQIFVSGLFDSEEKNPGENLTESFTQAGTFDVRCHIHPKMKLVVHV